MSKNQGKFALGALIAGVAGFAAGILSAPKSGKETRADIKKAANKALVEGERQLKKLHSELGELLDKAEAKAKTLQGAAKVEIDKKLFVARAAKDKSRELLTALHEGEAENKELEASLKEIKAALAHLKAFIKQ
jgi:gas vesicle protein